MKGKDFRPNEKTIELLDGKHKIAMDFGAYEQLEEIYGDMNTAFDKFSAVKEDGTPSLKFKDVKNFLCAGINACIEDPGEHLTPFELGRLIDVNKIATYANALMGLVGNSLPDKEVDEDAEDDTEKN